MQKTNRNINDKRSMELAMSKIQMEAWEEQCNLLDNPTAEELVKELE